MKVSILTYHDEDNYGATLQAYATYKAIEDLGHKVEFINLKLPKSNSYLFRAILSLKRIRFNRFRKKYFKNLTRTYLTLDELQNDPPKSDCYLVGSDQTWNTNISKSLAPAFFLDFGDESVRRVAYASSLGMDHFVETPELNSKKVSGLLSLFKDVLVREDDAVNICSKLWGINAKQVVDPVLLFDNFNFLLSKSKVEKNQLGLYKIYPDNVFYNKAMIIANSLGVKATSIGSLRKKRGIQCPYPCGIEKWIEQIATSKYVLTDSFHGTVLSVLYRRPFVVYVTNPDKISRIRSLLSLLGLSERICSPTTPLDEIMSLLETKIDYVQVHKILSTLRKESLQLLKSALE